VARHEPAQALVRRRNAAHCPRQPGPGAERLHRHPARISSAANDTGARKPEPPAFHCRASHPHAENRSPVASSDPIGETETIIHPRWHTPFETTKRGVGSIILLLVATLLSPLPFSHIIPALVIMLVSFAYLEEDGVLLCVSLAAALASFAITAATVWATVSATGLLEKLLWEM
jgi:hypothetical protein